jgi:hypothetical protein
MLALIELPSGSVDRREFRVKMWGTSSPDDKLTGDLANVIELGECPESRPTDRVGFRGLFCKFQALLGLLSVAMAPALPVPAFGQTTSLPQVKSEFLQRPGCKSEGWTRLRRKQPILVRCIPLLSPNDMLRCALRANL